MLLLGLYLFAKGHGINNDPFRGYGIVFIIAGTCILIGSLNQVQLLLLTPMAARAPKCSRANSVHVELHSPKMHSYVGSQFFNYFESPTKIRRYGSEQLDACTCR